MKLRFVADAKSALPVPTLMPENKKGREPESSTA
jgi:hypothetical protein